MAKQTINIGSAANDGTGSTLRESFDITNDNFTELYDGSGGLLHKIEGTNFTGSLLVGHSTTGTLDNAFYNTALGIGSLDALTTGDNNVAIGYNAGTSINSGETNVVIGAYAGDAVTTGDRNVAIGYQALSAEDTGHRNVAIGYNALQVQNYGDNNYNVAVGYNAGSSVTSGLQNTIIGALAGDAIESGQDITALGYNAAAAITGSSNTCIGSGAGSGIVAGTDNTMIGKNTTLAASASNSIVIGSGAGSGSIGSNTIVFGDSNITDVRIPADSTLKIGASGDLQLEHLSSNSFIKNTAVGDLYIENQVDDKDVIFRSDDGSGGVATYFFLDGSAERNIFSKDSEHPDNVSAYFGSSNDFRIHHNGSHTFLSKSGTGDLRIVQNIDDGDILFQSDDGSGGVTTYFKCKGDETVTQFVQNTNHQDNAKATFGTGLDLEIYHDTSNSYVTAKGTGNLIIQNTTDDSDISFKSDDGSGGTTAYLTLDGSVGYTTVQKDIRFEDNVQLELGTDRELTIYSDGSNGLISNQIGDLSITNAADDKDIIFNCDNGSGGTTAYLTLDGGITSILAYKDLLMAVDGTGGTIKLGASQDLQIQHNGTDSQITNTTGHLQFTNTADDKDISFASDNGSGGDTIYLTLDGGDVSTIVHTVKVLMPNLPTSDPSVAGQLYTDSGVLKVSAG